MTRPEGSGRPKLPPHKVKTYSMTEKDVELVQWLATYLGTTKAEAVRTAIRAFAGQMIMLEKKGPN